MPNTIGKTKALLKLAKLRQSTRLADYDCIGDFHGGIFECDYVSPLTKSGNNVDAGSRVVEILERLAVSRDNPGHPSVRLAPLATGGA